MTPRRDDDSDFPDDSTTAADVRSADGGDLGAGGTGRGRFLTLDEVADILRVDGDLVRTLVETYELPAIRVGGRGPWRVESDVLEQFIDDRYEAQRREARLHLPESDDFAELWGPRIPEDGAVDDTTDDVESMQADTGPVGAAPVGAGAGDAGRIGTGGLSTSRDWPHLRAVDVDDVEAENGSDPDGGRG